MRKLIIIGALLVVLIGLLFASGMGLFFMLWTDKAVYEVKEGIKTAGIKHKPKEELKPIVREYVRESYSLLGIPLPRSYIMLKSIAKFGKPGIECVINILKDKEEGKKMVKFMWGGVKPKSMRLAALYVIKMISEIGKEGNKDFKQAYEAVREQIPALVEVLLHDEDVEVRIKTAETLGDIGDTQAVDGLIKALDDSGEIDVGQVEPKTVREASARALGKIKDFRAVVPLIKALERESENSSALSGMAYVLGEIGDRRAVRPMIELIKEGRLLKWKPWHRPPIVTDIGKLGGGGN